MKSILFVFAHPDDESFLCAGTIAKYTKLGYKVDLLCITKGEAGNRGEYKNSSEPLGIIREQELKDVVDLLGIASVTYLEYQDGKLSKLTPGELEDKIYKQFINHEPDIIITFGPEGVSNHPDHIKLSFATTYAFQKYAEFMVDGKELGQRDSRRKFVSKLGGYEHREEPKLYYAVIPESVALFLIDKNVLPQESFGKPWKGIDDKKITTVIDISEFTETKVAAIAKHRSQLEDAERFLSIDNQPLMYKEYFVLRMQGKEEIFMGKGDDVRYEL